MIPDKILVEIYAQCGFRSESLLALLDVLKGLPEFKPTHWARDERPSSKNIYSQDDLLLALQSLGNFEAPHLYSNTAPTYTAFFSIERKNLNQLIIRFNSGLNQESLIKILQLSSALADALRAEYGFVYPIWKNAPEKYMQRTSVTLSSLQKCGLSPLFARTWLGSHLIELIGWERLKNCGAWIKNLPYGGIQVDLVENLVDTDHRTLTIRQREVMKHLLPSGVFGDYSPVVFPKPGLNWHPIPIDSFVD